VPSLIELRQSRTQLISEAQRVALDPKPTVETRAKFAAMMTDVEAMETDIANIERVEKLDAENRSTQRSPRPNPGANASEHEEREAIRKSALIKYLKGETEDLDAEERSLLREQRDITTGGTTTGGVLIGQLGPLVFDAQKAIGNLAGEVMKKSTPGNGAPLKITSMNDTGNQLVTLTEDTSISDTDPSFGAVTLQSTDTVATLIKVTWQELADAVIDLDAFLRTKIGVRYMRGLEDYVVNGNSSNISSIITGATLAETSAANTGPAYQDFVNVYGALDPSYLPNAKWAMNNKTRAYLLGQLDNYGRPLFVPNVNTGNLDQILGQPVVISQAMAAANVATNTGVLFGDFSQGYVLRDSGPLYVKRLDERYADQLASGFLAYARLSGTNVDAGTHPILKLVTHA
jgi:HK97 family phage major capsid protein